MQNAKNCKCEELIDKEICDKGCILNPCYCECECDKSCDVGEYIDYEICKFRKSLIDNLVEECIKILIYDKTVNDYRKICGYCKIYIVLFVIFLIISISISSVFIYFRWYLKSATNITNINPETETTIYYTYKWEISSKLILKIVHITFLMT